MHILCFCTAEEEISNSESIEELCSVTYKNIFPVIVGIAVSTNIINVIVLSYLQRRTQPTPARIYLIWLAVTHCFACVPILIGLAKGDRKHIPYSWAFYFSHVEEPLYNALNFVCVYIIIALSFDRFSAVCNVHKYTQTKGFRIAYIAVAAAYGIGVLFYMPYCFSEKPRQKFNASDQWNIRDSWLLEKPLWIGWSLGVQIIHRIVSSFILVYINMHIFITVSRLGKLRRSGSNQSQTSLRIQKDRQLLNLLMALTFTFLLTNIPSGALKMKKTFEQQQCNLDIRDEIIRSVTNCLEMAGYCFDFLFYFVMNSEYRRALLRIIGNITSCFHSNADNVMKSVK